MSGFVNMYTVTPVFTKKNSSSFGRLVLTVIHVSNFRELGDFVHYTFGHVAVLLRQVVG